MTDARASEFGAGKAISVKPSAIDKELAGLWRGVAELDRERGAAVTRACLWNLVVATSSEASFERAKRAIDEVSPLLPARVLVLKTARDAASKPVEAWVEANWHQTGGGAKVIGSEEVTLAASGEAVDDLAQMVRALLVADVPTAAFWYESAPGESALDRALLAAADRLVIGGSSERGLGNLARIAERRRTRADLIGLSWLRAAPWRQMLASLFDPPTPAEELLQVTRVELACAPERLGAAYALVGWLASRLGWRDPRPIEPHQHEWRRADGGALSAKISLEPGAPDPLQRVALCTPSGEYELLRAGGAIVANTPSIAYKHPVHFPEERELWIQALSAQGRDPLFAEAIRAIAPLTHA